MLSSHVRFKELLLVLATVVLVAGLYFPVHAFDFVWDDKILIINDHRLQSGVLTWETISRPVLDNTTYLRPLVFLTYFLEIKLFGVNPAAFHIVNLLIFLLNVLLAYFLAHEILKRLGCENLAWLVSLLYGVHPVLVESTAWISGRFDLLATTFIFLSLIVFFGRKKPTWLTDLAIAILFFAGLLSKELAIIVPGMMLLYTLAVSQAGGNSEKIRHFFKENARLVVVLCLVVILYFCLRINSMGGVYHFKSAIENSQDRGVFFPLKTLVFYLHQVLLPFFDINPQHDVDLEMLKGYQNPVFHWIAFALLVLLLVLAVKGHPLGWLGLAAIFSLSLVLHIIPMTIGKNIGHERFLTTPLLFFLIFFAYAGERIYSMLPPRPVKKYLGSLLVGIFLVGSFFTTQSVIPIWRSNYTLWSWMYQKTPDIDYVSTAYFLALLNEKRMDEFEPAFKKILNSGKEMTPMQKVFYSTYLLERRDPSSTMRINEAIAAIKSHTGDRENNVIASLSVASGMLYYLYVDKAISLATLDGDVKGALVASLEADQWKSSKASLDYKALWSRLAYYTILRDHQAAGLLYEKIKNATSIDGQNLVHSYLDIYYKYCLGFDLKSEAACEKKALSSLAEIGEHSKG